MTPEHWPDPMVTLVQSFQGDTIPNLNVSYAPVKPAI